MGAMASQITSLMIVYSTIYSGADQSKHQSSASLAFVWGIHRDRWFPAQMASNTENVFIWWSHHGVSATNSQPEIQSCDTFFVISFNHVWAFSQVADELICLNNSFDNTVMTLLVNCAGLSISSITYYHWCQQYDIFALNHQKHRINLILPGEFIWQIKNYNCQVASHTS